MDSNSQIHLRILEQRGHEISKADLNKGKTEETEQMMTDEEIFEEVKEEESLTEILGPPNTTAKIKPDTAFNCINTCITWAEENGVSAKDVIVLRNIREKVFKQKLQVAKKADLN
ncbi:unnamed protein product [Parnassius mnemosyne]|uniref:Uncharacterized protein n=1 Tax=Parnassius mnemosyne TaxID=213953 RepID=A0AAV1LA43_9NEOP